MFASQPIWIRDQIDRFLGETFMWNLGEYRKHPQRLADHLPWATLIAPSVMLNKDGSLQKTIAFRGPDLDSSTPYELVAARARMNNVLRRLGSHWCVHVEASRRLAQVYRASQFPNAVAAMVDEERRDSFGVDAVFHHVHISASRGRNDPARRLLY
jgi:type IV secretory pathway VirB4 component